jgi:tetratricopeptide (TPR) repeat protein
MKNLIWSFCFLLVGLSQASASKPVENTQRESPSYIADLMVEALETGSYEKIDERFDKIAFTDKTMKAMNLDKSIAGAVREKIIEIISLEMVFKNALGTLPPDSINAKMIGVAHKASGPVPIVRVNFGDAGYNFYELSLHQKRGQYFLDDIFIIANAQQMSDSIAQAMALIFNQPQGILSGIKLDAKEQVAATKILTEVMAHKKTGDFAAAYESMKTLPKYLTDSDVIHLAIVTLAGAVSDDVYRDELAAFAKRHGDNPRYTFMLIDHYTYAEDYDHALKNVDSLLTRYKNDASLLSSKADIYVLQKDYKNANSALVAAIAQEPDYENAYWSAVTVALTEKKYDAATEWLKKYEAQFGFEFSAENFEGQEIYKKYIKSKPFKRWMKTKET